MEDENEFNPYASPALADANPPSSTREFRVQGNCVVVTSGCELPLRCIITNAACNVADQRHQKLTYIPSFRLVIRGRTCYLTRCIHPKLRMRILLIRCLASLAAFLAIVWMLPNTIAIAIAIVVAATVAVAAFFAVPPNRLKIVNYRNGEYWIKGFSESFLDSLVTVDKWKRM